ncbi:MAG TPA: histidine kinase, partial [Ferruginibacter sp.]|nr:histidine kinase [Ferruginibacter sp.]
AMNTVGHSEQLFITSRLQVLQMMGDTLQQNHSLTQWIRQLEKNNANYKSLFYQLQVINGNRVILQDQWRSYSYNMALHQPMAHQPEDVQFPGTMYLISLRDSIPYYIKHPSVIDTAFSTSIKKEVTIALQNARESKKMLFALDEQDYVNWRTVYARTADRFFFGINNKLLVVNRDLSYQIITLPKRIISLYIDPHQGLWMGMVTGGGYYFSDAHHTIDLQQGIPLLSDLSVSGFCEDREGNVWCTTLEKGLFYAASPAIRYYRESALGDRHVYFLRNLQNEIFTSSRVDELYSISYQHMELLNLRVKQNFEISDVHQQANRFYVATKAILYQFKRNNQSFELEHSEPVSLYEMASHAQHLYGISRGWLVEIGDRCHRRIISLPTKAYSLVMQDTATAFIGGADGLFRINLNRQQYEAIKNFTAPVSRVIISKKNEVFLTTYGKGFGKLVHDQYLRLSGDSLPDGFNDLTEDRYGNIWLASRQGLYQYNPSTQVFQLLNRSNGLLSDNVNKLAADNQSLYVSTSDGLCVFPLQQSLFNSHPPSIALNQLRVNGQSIGNGIYHPLAYQENNISWQFDVFSYKRGGEAGILYQLSGYDTNFVFNKDANIAYRHLEPGNYRLTVYAVNNNGVRSTTPLVYRFSIEPPFWKTAIFYLFLTIAGLGLLALLGWLIIRRIKSKEAEKTRIHQLIADSRLSALQAQMNPHFIFNSINSIQNYILDKNEQQAYDYLSKFSKLIRHVLVNSRQKLISLQDELETLRLYVDLEKLRFDHA